MKKLTEISAFFPFWNEEKNIENVVGQAIPVLSELAQKWEIIIVDDGSTDKTPILAKKIQKKHKNISIITHRPNRGYGAALKSGLTNAKHKYIIFTDGDGQFDFSEARLLVEEINKSDIVIGYRKKRQDENILIRLLLMYLLKIWDFVLFRFYVKDIDCGFKLFKQSAIEAMLPLRSEGAMITTEILAKAKVKNLKITQVGVTHYPRKHGDQTGANLQVIIRAVIESFVLWWDIKNKRF